MELRLDGRACLGGRREEAQRGPNVGQDKVKGQLVVAPGDVVDRAQVEDQDTDRDYQALPHLRMRHFCTSIHGASLEN
mgnify:CR=1 FL=1